MNRISVIGFVTRDRVPSLERAVESYIQNAKAHDRLATFVVMDDSENEGLREDCKSRLRALKDRYGVDIFYAGIEEKKHFLEILAQEAKISTEIIEFALLDPEHCGHTTGANRNALLLATIGDLFLMVDDDTVGRVAVPQDRQVGLKFISNPRLSDLQSFASAEDAFKAVRFEVKDIFSIHDPLLGTDFDKCLETYIDSEIDIEGVSPWFAKRLLDPKGRIKMVWMGILGDCGFTYPNYLLWLSGPGRKDVLRSEPHYRAVCRSRQILRVARTLSIGGDGGLFQSVALGLDNRELLPPFSPNYRGQDGIFGALFLKCLRDDFVAYPPWAVLHDPQPARENKPEDVWKGSGSVDFHMMLKRCLLSFEPSEAMPIAQRIQAMGNFLIQLSSRNQASFEQFVHEELTKSNTSHIESLENLLQVHHGQPRYWAADLKAYLKNLREGQKSPAYAVPNETRAGRTLQNAGIFSQRLVLRFGHLLTMWPQMIEATIRLRSRNIRLAQPV